MELGFRAFLDRGSSFRELIFLRRVGLAFCEPESSCDIESKDKVSFCLVLENNDLMFFLGVSGCPLLESYEMGSVKTFLKGYLN
jgi:hypothetical protein